MVHSSALWVGAISERRILICQDSSISERHRALLGVWITRQSVPLAVLRIRPSHWAAALAPAVTPRDGKLGS